MRTIALLPPSLLLLLACGGLGGAGSGDQPVGAAAAPATPTEVVEAIPAAPAPDAAPAKQKAPEFTVDMLPEDLRSGSADAREDALARHEEEPDATGAIVWVMKNDGDARVRFKAWRVVRARWKRGTGNFAENEAAAAWEAANGPDDARVEALEALGERGRNMTAAAKHLADPAQPVRVAAAEAVHDIGSRTGKRSEARKLLEARRDVESVASVRKKLSDWISEL